MNILAAFTPAESKRLIAKAVAVHPLVASAMREGKTLVSSGTTTAYCVEEMLGIRMEIERFPSGVVTRGVLCQTPDGRTRSILIDKGTRIDEDAGLSDYEELERHISTLGGGDVYIKGANAIDSSGNAGFLLAHPDGGNIIRALHAVYARGTAFIVPAGLEKLVASVSEAQRHMKGISQYDYTTGRGCGYVAVSNGIIVTEIEAISLLTNAQATHVASGGIGGSEGTVALVIEGDNAQLSKAVELIESIKGEPALPGWKMACSQCKFRCKYLHKQKT